MQNTTKRLMIYTDHLVSSYLYDKSNGTDLHFDDLTESEKNDLTILFFEESMRDLVSLLSDSNQSDLIASMLIMTLKKDQEHTKKELAEEIINVVKRYYRNQIIKHLNNRVEDYWVAFSDKFRPENFYS